MIRHTTVLSLAALALVPLARLAHRGPATADAGIVFSDDFQDSTIKPQWSSNSLQNRQAETVFSWFSGRYTTQTIRLTLPAVPPPKRGTGSNGDNGGDGGSDGGGDKYNLFTLTFDFFAIDSWDGEEPTNGPDRFLIDANGARIFNESFSNQGTTQSFRRPDVGPKQLGFDARWNDSIYRKIAVDFTVPDNQNIALDFRGTATQGLTDESWGIDNVQVSYKVVPTPGPLALVCLGGVLGLRRKR